MAYRIPAWRAALSCCLAVGAGTTALADSLLVDHGPPFTQTLSNTIPLVFGMTAADVASALGASLHYVRGRPGEETLVAIRNIGGGVFPREDRLFLQFRRGRLTGLRGDWGR